MADTPTDLAALAATPEGRAQMAKALATAGAQEAQDVLDILSGIAADERFLRLKLYAERAGDPQLRTFAGNVASSVEAHQNSVQGLLVAAKLAAS
jgi:hypothetical protein